MATKRKISVMLEKPEKLEGDTIYVQLCKDKQDVHAEVVSLKEFNHIDYSREAMSLIKGSMNVSNYVGDLNGYYHIPFDTFLEMLQKENDASIDYKPAVLRGLEALAILESERKDFDESSYCDRY